MASSVSKSVLPVCLDLAGRKVVVFGGGVVATRKVEKLLSAQAHVEVISPMLTDALRVQHERGEIVWHPRTYEEGDLDGVWMACAATNDVVVHAKIAAEAEEKCVFVNVVARPELGSMRFMSSVQRGLLTLAVSTSGHSPAMTRFMLRLLQGHVDSRHIKALEHMAKIRPIMRTCGTQTQRASFWNALIEGAFAFDLKNAEQVRSWIEEAGHEAELVLPRDVHVTIEANLEPDPT